MKRVVFLTPGDAWPGFRLAGLEQIPATTKNIPELLTSYADDQNVGLVVIDERLSSALSEELLARLDRHHPGKVTVLPSPQAGETNFALEVIRQAIGYHVRMPG